jgi:hypothetical protein
MTIETITLQLPESIVRQARQAASSSRRTVEEVLAAWVQPPTVPAVNNSELAEDLGLLPDAALLHEAQVSLAPVKARRLQALLDIQEERALTDAETAEALRLVSEVDRLTLRRARAMLILQQRGVPQSAASAPTG